MTVKGPTSAGSAIFDNLYAIGNSAQPTFLFEHTTVAEIPSGNLDNAGSGPFFSFVASINNLINVRIKIVPSNGVNAGVLDDP